MDPDSLEIQQEDQELSPEAKARVFRRLSRRLRRTTPGQFDGDNDGFTFNPRTGRDDMPAPRRTGGTRRYMDAWTRRQAPGGQFVAQSRAFRDDASDEALEELLGRAGVNKPRQIDRWSGKPTTPPGEERDRNFSPVEVERRPAKLKSISQNQFLRLMDDLVDYTKKLKDEPIDERNNKRVWKLLFVMQKINSMNNIRRAGSGSEITISEDELKRLSKGLESMIDNLDVWTDDEDAQSLFKEIKKLSSAGWNSLPKSSSTEKSLTDYEVKSIGRAIGRRARGAVRRVFNRTNIDGDGDGFRTNPMTGRDDVPVVDAPDVAKAKKPLSIADVQMISLRRRGQQIQRASRTQKPGAGKNRTDMPGSTPGGVPQDFFDFLNQMFGPKVTDDDRVQAVKAGLVDIKDRPWSIFDKRMNDIKNVAAKKFPNLDTPEDFEDAFKELHPNVSFQKDTFPDDLGDVEKSFLTGIIGMMILHPDRFAKNEKITVTKSRDPKQRAQPGGAYTAWQERVKTRRDFPMLKKVFPKSRTRFVLGDDMYDGRPYRMQDGISNQAIKAYLRENPNVPASEQIKKIREINGMIVAIHEAGHGLHRLAAEEQAFPDSLSDAEIDDKINDYIISNPTKIFNDRMEQVGATALSRWLWSQMFLLDVQPNQQMIDDLGQQLADPSLTGEAREKLQNFYENIFEAVNINNTVATMMSDQQKLLSYEPLLNYLDGERKNGRWDPELTDRLVNFYGYENRDVMRRWGIDYESARTGLTEQELRDEFRNSAAEYASAVQNLIATGLWNELTSKEKQLLSASWKYISSYAKDKHSYYLGSNLGASVEGVAEALAMRMMGFDFFEGKVSQEVRDALTKLLRFTQKGPNYGNE